MPRGKGKANYKVDTLILVVEELLPNGAQSWAEVAALYQSRSGEMILRDHDDVKRYWIEKCCNKFKKPTGTPGDPKRDMILRCQRIQERIHNKSASTIMGVESEGDDGLSLDSDEEDEDDDDDDVEGEVAAVLGGELGVGGSRVGSGAATPTVAGDGGLVDGGLGVCSVEEVGIPRIPPLVTQQFTEGPYVGPQPIQTPQQLANAAATGVYARGEPAAWAGCNSVGCCPAHGVARRCSVRRGWCWTSSPAAGDAATCQPGAAAFYFSASG